MWLQARAVPRRSQTPRDARKTETLRCAVRSARSAFSACSFCSARPARPARSCCSRYELAGNRRDTAGGSGGAEPAANLGESLEDSLTLRAADLEQRQQGGCNIIGPKVVLNEFAGNFPAGNN